MRQNLTFLSDEDTQQQAQVSRLSLVLIINGSLYPCWAKIHYMVDSNAVDSYWERIAVYGAIIALVIFARLSRISPKKKMALLAANRWIVMAHCFSLVARNHVAIHYAIPVFFVTFLFATAFERPKSFLPFAAFAMAGAMACESTNPIIPTFYFRMLIATCLILSYFVMNHRYELTRTIRGNEAMLRDMFAAAGVGMAVVDLQGYIFTANRALAKMFALSVKELAGRHFEDFSAGVNSASFQKNFMSLVRNEISALKTEHCFLDSNGRSVWGKISATRITSTGTFILALVEDISAQKATELLIRDRQEKMQYSSRMAALGEMAGGVAHEINNPLAIIDLTANVLENQISKNELDPVFARESLDKIQKMINRIAKIVRGLRSFSRDGSHDLPQLYAAKEVLENTLALCEEKLKSNNISLRIAKPPSDYIVKCRGVEVSQVLLNVLNNAFDAVVNHPEKWIEINFAPEEKFVRVDISNSGPLVPDELKHKIFQPFFTTKPVGQGVGLGLSISHGIMSSQGGNLFLNQEMPNTCFSVLIPRDFPPS